MPYVHLEFQLCIFAVSGCQQCVCVCMCVYVGVHVCVSVCTCKFAMMLVVCHFELHLFGSFVGMVRSDTHKMIK